MFRQVRSLLLMLLCATVCTSSCTSKDDGSPLTQDTNQSVSPLSPNDSNRVTPTPLTDANTGVPAQGGNVVIVGRTSTWNGNQVVLSWSGTQVTGGFTGTSITALLTPADQGSYSNLGNVNNFIDVSVDGKALSPIEVTQGVSRIALASGLAAGTHSITFTKRTEAQLGSLLFTGFAYAAGGGPAPTAARPTRRFEFIGDSGLVGYGADGNARDGQTPCSFTPKTEDASVSYAFVASQQLNADTHIVGCSGKGIARNRDTVNDSVETLPVLWTWTIGDREFSQADWQPSTWPADAVVVTVGGNDFANDDGSYSAPSASTFAAKANPFMKQLRAAYPNAWLFVITSPMLDASIRTSAESLAQAMAASVGDSKAAFLPLFYDDGSRGWGCDYHMTIATHKLVGQTLAKAIAAKTGWQ